MTFTVAIIGRPNVGKSTLFNRLPGKRLALVHDTPGVTRDRREAEARLGALDFRIIDTAGLEEAAPETPEARMRAQTERALQDADIALFLVDARTGITPLDHHFARWLRESGVPVIVIANKCEGRAANAGAYEAFELGLGEPLVFSAAHGEGLDALHDALIRHRDDVAESPRDRFHEGVERPLKLAIVGRPNAGKSTLVNTLVGEERMLTGPEPGLTRDAVAIDWAWKGHQISLFDTAGLRRRAKMTADLDRLSSADTLRAIRFAEIVVLLIDARTPFEKQDRHIAALVAEEGRALVIGLNKWDLVKDRGRTLKTLRATVEEAVPQVHGVPVTALSAVNGTGTDHLIKAAVKAYDLWNRRLATGPLNRWLAEVVERHPPPARSGRRTRIRFATQVKARPPTFVFFCNRPDSVPESYRRYLVNGLRETFDLPGVPIRVHLRKGDNPYV